MKLNDYLDSQKIPVEDFASAAGLAAVTIYKYMAGKRRPRLKALEKIYHATGGAVTANDFFEEPPPQKKKNGHASRGT
jgi:transcriptional regulator with XRE-family HTH domain